MKRLVSILGIGFGILALASCNSNETTNKTNVKDDYELKVACPSGAPILGIASAVCDFKSSIDTSNIGVDATVLSGFFNEEASDIVIAPINMGCNLYNAGKSTFKFAGVITAGNTYFASKEEFVLDDIKERDLYLFGNGSITSFGALYVLNENDITPKSLDYTANANVSYSGNNIYMTAEPTLSVAKNSLSQSNETLYSKSIADLYNEVSSHTLIQAAIFVNPKTIQEHKSLVNQFLTDVSTKDELTKTNVTKVQKDAKTLGLNLPDAVIETAIPNSKVEFISASDSKDDLEFMVEESLRYEEEGIISKTFFTKAPNDNFYYNI